MSVRTSVFYAHTHTHAHSSTLAHTHTHAHVNAQLFAYVMETRWKHGRCSSVRSKTLPAPSHDSAPYLPPFPSLPPFLFYRSSSGSLLFCPQLTCSAARFIALALALAPRRNEPKLNGHLSADRRLHCEKKVCQLLYLIVND